MSKQQAQEPLSQEEKMLRGTAWSTFADFVSRLLGALYIIPWYSWMGTYAPQANALFTLGYNIYAYFLLLSTMGLNVAVAKQIAKYNVLGQEDKIFQLARSLLKTMLIVGVLLAAVLYFGAPFFSRISGAEEQLIPILKSLAPAVLAFPVMSVIRGIFWGYNNLKPNSLSQISEQLLRVIWMLLTTFFIMKLGSKDYIAAVAQSTFAAFIGMLASLGTLVYYLKQSGLLEKLLKTPEVQVNRQENLSILLTSMKEAFPFIITGSAIQFFALIDQATFINTLLRLTDYTRDELTVLYSYISANPNKIIMIIIAVAGSINGMGTVLITETFTQKDRRGTARLIINTFQMLFSFIVPALTGAILLADALYITFYGPSEPVAITLFILLLIQAFLLSVYTVLPSMLHSISESKKAITYTVYGFIIKLITILPSFYLFKIYGPVLSTNLGLIISIGLMYRYLKKVTRFNARLIKKNTLTILLLTLIMAFFVTLLRLGMDYVIPVTTRFNSILYLLLCGCTGATIYGYLALKTRIVDNLIGSRSEKLRQLFHIK